MDPQKMGRNRHHYLRRNCHLNHLMKGRFEQDELKMIKVLLMETKFIGVKHRRTKDGRNYYNRL